MTVFHQDKNRTDRDLPRVNIRGSAHERDADALPVLSRWRWRSGRRPVSRGVNLHRLTAMEKRIDLDLDLPTVQCPVPAEFHLVVCHHFVRIVRIKKNRLEWNGTHCAHFFLEIQDWFQCLVAQVHFWSMTKFVLEIKICQFGFHLVQFGKKSAVMQLSLGH